MPSAPVVTVITPTYNRAPFLRETISSVLNQAYPALDYLVLDDGSTDDSAVVLAEYGDRVRVVSHPNMGEVRTVNRGMAMATGDFVMIVNSDDPLRPGALAALVEALTAAPEALAAYPDWDDIDAEGGCLRTHRLAPYTLESLVTTLNIPLGPGVLMRRSAIERAGPRNTACRFVHDLDYWLRLAALGPLLHVPQSLATHRTHAASTQILCQGWRLAWEVSRLAYDVLARPALPCGLARQRLQILANAHWVAQFYCGSSRVAREYHQTRRAWLQKRLDAQAFFTRARRFVGRTL